ncbi:MAG TPA: transposase, partial [Ktedonobacteraceae bacterium]|nr:transposase [Ktedonobacteraceae bacterium]
AWFAANQALFNRVCAFYFDVIAAHEKILDLSNKDALTALEKLTHTTQSNPHPVMPLEEVAEDIPAMFRRAAINAALGSARSFYSHLSKWRKRKEKAQAKGKKFIERPPVPPRSWNKSAMLYAGQWKERAGSSIMIKVWTGSVWSWIKVRLTGREIPDDAQMGSPSLIRCGNQWWLHTPIEKQFKSPGKIEKQVMTNEQTKICSVDLNINEHLAVCTIRMVEGSILATTFIGGGRRVNGLRKQQLGRIAYNRRKTGIIAENEQDNADLWRKICNTDEQVAHLVSARIVQFAKQHGATIVVFEHLGNLKPTKGKYSKRGNEKRAYWMKGRIFKYAKYKAYNAGIVTSRVNPRNTSRECARCHSLVARYEDGKPEQGYTYGAPLVACHQCGMKGNSDRNASLVIGQRLVERYQKHPKEKPLASLHAERGEQSPGVEVCQDAKSVGTRPSLGGARHADGNEHGTAQEIGMRMVEPVSDMTYQLRFPF